MEEIWKDVFGYEGCYLVSNYGRVKTIPRIKTLKSGQKLKIKENIFQPAKDPKYYIVSLTNLNGIHKTHKIHKLVMHAFHGRKKESINHIDGNKLNNKLDNLEYISCYNNLIHYHKNNSKTSNFIGVCFDKNRNKWRASIHINKWISLGRHDSQYSAYKSRLKAEIKFYDNGTLPKGNWQF